MIKALTRSRSASFHRKSMLKVLIVSILLIVCWGPIKPLRSVTAWALYTAGDLVNSDTLEFEPQTR